MPAGPSNIYSDLDLDFEINPFDGDLYIKYDDQAVKRSLRNLLLTERFEKPFQPNVYVGIRQNLFELYTPIDIGVLKQDIFDIINKYEPRVYDLDVKVNTNYDSNEVSISITYSIRFVGVRDQITLVLERLR
jgi:predicted component of type VI protein secretion system